MDRLYEKNKIWFALVWIGVYVVGTSLAEEISRWQGAAKLVTALFHTGLCTVMLVWLRKHGRMKYFGLCRSGVPAKKLLYYLPLAALASCNLWFGLRMNMPAWETVFYVISMLCVGFLEELIFRGFLFRAMEESGLKSAIIVSSVTFGVGHIVNLFNGSGVELLPNLCQVCYAMAFGFLTVVIFYKSGSLLPCIAVHSVINALSGFADETGATPARTIATGLFLTVGALLYAGFIWKNLPGHTDGA